MTTNKSDPIEQLILGHQEFKQSYLDKDNEAYRREAAVGQKPKVAIISCSDSRVNPMVVNHINLGQVFSIQNVANIVPPYRPDEAHHETSAAIEYAVLGLNVEHIIIFGHSSCGGIRALVENNAELNFEFVQPWVSTLDSARQTVREKFSQATLDEQCYHCEREGVKVSLNNLMSYPWIKEKVMNQSLQLHGWHFDIPTGDISRFDAQKESFIRLD